MAYDIYADHAVLAKYTAAGDKVTIPSEYQGLPVTAVGEYAFLGNSSVVSVTIPDSVTLIGESAFAMCKNLETITIPTSVNEIGGYAFSNTKWLYAQRAENTLVIVNNIVADGGACGKSANIPEGTVAISDYAFADCYELADVTIPASVKVIGATSFSGTPWEAKNLSSAGALVINDMHVKGCNKVDDREDIIIEQDKIQNYAFAECEGYKNMQLGGQIKTIGNSAFSALKGLETFELFSPVTDIQAHAFEDCHSLKSFVFQNPHVENIGSYVFRNCTSLAEISLPSTVKSLGKGAFENCSAMKKITIFNEKCFIFDSPETINKEAVICGYSGSTAEAYAKKYSRTFVVLEPAQVTTTAPAVTTTAAPTSTTAVTTAAAPVTTQTNGNKVVITLPNVPEGSKIIVIVTNGDTDGNGKVDYIDYNLLCELLCDDEIKGDANGDGRIDIADLATLRQLVSHHEVDINEKNADLNGDGKADMTDMSKLSMILVGD